MMFEDSCRFWDYVMCPERDKCEKCGWNPEVQKKRAEKLRKENENERSASFGKADG